MDVSTPTSHEQDTLLLLALMKTHRKDLRTFGLVSKGWKAVSKAYNKLRPQHPKPVWRLKLHFRSLALALEARFMEYGSTIPLSPNDRLIMRLVEDRTQLARYKTNTYIWQNEGFMMSGKRVIGYAAMPEPVDLGPNKARNKVLSDHFKAVSRKKATEYAPCCCQTSVPDHRKGDGFLGWYLGEKGLLLLSELEMLRRQLTEEYQKHHRVLLRAHLMLQLHKRNTQALDMISHDLCSAFERACLGDLSCIPSLAYVGEAENSRVWGAGFSPVSGVGRGSEA